jgi:hypothetical protein
MLFVCHIVLGCVVYTFLLAVLCEGMSYGQGKVRNLTFLQSKRTLRKLIMSLLYGLQQCLGWTLMLISMTFSLELFICIILGIVVGKTIIFPTQQTQLQRQQYTTGRWMPRTYNDGQQQQHRQSSDEFGRQILDSPTRNNGRQEATISTSSTFRRRRR